MVEEITEADIASLTTTDTLLAAALAKYANAIADEVVRKNREILQGSPVAIRAMGSSSLSILFNYKSTINSVASPVNDNTVLSAIPQKIITIEYTWNYAAVAHLLGLVADSGALVIGEYLAEQYATHALRRAILSKLFGDKADDESDQELILSYILDHLQEHSPRLTGAYSESFRLTGDGQEIEPEEATEDMQEFVFVNMTPYARKIEQGLSQQTPEGVFEGVAAIAAYEFSDVADISFEWREPPPEVLTRLNRTPAITVTFR